jgi:glycosyltransferase involved in cell wall biosynthesis
MNSYKVAVLLPVAKSDRADFFIEALRSMLDQSYKDFVLCICVDGQLQPEVENILETCEDPRIKIFRNSNNIGLAASLNRVIQAHEADIYFRMDADDISRADRLEKMIERLEDTEDLVLGTDCIEIDKTGNHLFYKAMPGKADIPGMIYSRSPFVHPSVAIRKEFFDSVGYYNESFKQFQDLELWARGIIAGVAMDNLNEPLLYFRLSENFIKKRSSWTAIRNELKVSILLIREQRKYLKIFPAIIGKLGFRLLIKLVPDRWAIEIYNFLRK